MLITDWADFSNMIQSMATNFEKQGAMMQQQANNFYNNNNFEENNILRTVDLIESGNSPADVQSKTTSFTTVMCI